MFYSYIYWNPVTDTPFYVGKGKNNRANTHLSGRSTNKQVNGYIRNLRENGIEPVVEIVHTVNESAAFWMERMVISAYGRMDRGTGCLMNHSDGGEGPTGAIREPRSEEVKMRISATLKGMVKTEQHRMNISAAMQGIVFSESHKIALRKPKRRK